VHFFPQSLCTATLVPVFFWGAASLIPVLHSTSTRVLLVLTNYRRPEALGFIVSFFFCRPPPRFPRRVPLPQMSLFPKGLSPSTDLAPCTFTRCPFRPHAPTGALICLFSSGSSDLFGILPFPILCTRFCLDEVFPLFSAGPSIPSRSFRPSTLAYTWLFLCKCQAGAISPSRPRCSPLKH